MHLPHTPPTSRRSFLLGSLAAGLAATLPLRTAAAEPASTAPAAAPRGNPGHHRKAVGELQLITLLDGAVRGQVGIIQDLDPATARAALEAEFQPEPFPLVFTSFAVETPTGLVLIDAGCGGVMGPQAGHALGHLQAAGHSAQAVRRICLTHLHGDHIGGLIDAEGRAVYPEAELILPQGEADYWLSEAEAERAPEAARGGFALARKALAAYGERVRRISAGEVHPGITAVPAPGHTPGHTAYRLDSGRESLLVWGDLIHVPAVQFAHPEATLQFDIDNAAAAKTRARLLESIVAERQAVAGMHLHFPAVGHVAAAGKAYRWIPAVWDV